MVDVNENCDVKTVPVPIWQCIKDSINTLVDANVGTDVKQEAGQLLLNNISLLEKPNRAEKNVEERCVNVVTYLNELREHVHVTVGKILTIVDKAAVFDEQTASFWKRIAVLEEKIRIMDNVNANFRKIMRLENDYLRDLLRADREKIRRMREKLISLQTRLKQLECDDEDDSDSTAETIVANEREDCIPVADHPAQQFDIPSTELSMDSIVEMIVRNISKDDILRVLKNIGSERASSSYIS